MDFLFGLGQVLCIIGLLYGAWLSIKWGVHDDLKLESRSAPATENRMSAEPLTGYDALTGHSWRANPPLG